MVIHFDLFEAVTGGVVLGLFSIPIALGFWWDKRKADKRYQEKCDRDGIAL